MRTFRPASVQISDALLSFMAQVQWQSQTLTCFFRMKCTFEWHPAGRTCCISCKAGCSLPRNSGKGVRDAQSLPAVSCTWGKEATGEPERGGMAKGGCWRVRGEGWLRNSIPLGQPLPSYPPLKYLLCCLQYTNQQK